MKKLGYLVKPNTPMDNVTFMLRVQRVYPTFLCFLSDLGILLYNDIGLTSSRSVPLKQIQNASKMKVHQRSKCIKGSK